MIKMTSVKKSMKVFEEKYVDVFPMDWSPTINIVLCSIRSSDLIIRNLSRIMVFIFLALMICNKNLMIPLLKLLKVPEKYSHFFNIFHVIKEVHDEHNSIL